MINKAPLTSALFLLTALIGPLAVQAQPTVSFDTVSTRRVGPGMVHTEVVETNVPWTLDVLEVDLTNSFLDMKTALTKGDVDNGSEVVSSMAARHDSAGHRVVGAVNGDFYVGSRPASIQIQAGEVVQDEAVYYGNPRPAIGFASDNRVMMEIVNYSGSLLMRDSVLAIDKVNETRGADQLVLYNRFIGASTGTNQYGTEAAVRPVEEWIANDTLGVVVEAVQQGQGDMQIPTGGAVLSGHGTAADVLSGQVTEGDTLQVSLNALPGLSRIEDMLAGYPFIVKNGTSEVGPRGDADDRHPRTAVGFSADSTRLYLVTVDGRQQSSAGMTLPALADFMTRLGVHTAMNLDGGGSSTMIVRGDVVNSPSGGTQRAIASNALLAVSTAPRGELNDIQITPTQSKLFMGTSMRFEARGTDQYYNTVALNADSLGFRVEPSGLGTITSDGRLTAGTEADTGNVYVSYKSHTDTARVVVKTIARFDMTPRDVVTDTTRQLRFKIAVFDQDGQRQSFPRKSFEWHSTDPTVGLVDSTGQFQGVGEGTTQVVASYRGLSDTARVTVNVKSGVQLINAMENAEAWRLSGDNMNMEETQLSVSEDHETQGQGALRIDYTYPADGLHYVYMAAEQPLESVPDTLYIDARSSNTAYNQIQVEVEDAQGHPFRLFSTMFANEGTFKTLPMAVDDAAPLDEEHGDIYFPIQIQRLRIQLRGRPEEGQSSYSGTLYLDNLRAKYSAKQTGISEKPEVTSPLELLSAFPNPFEEQVTIAYKLARPRSVRLVVYDVLGRRVRKLVDSRQSAGRHEVELDGETLPAGVYFYRLRAGEYVLTGNATKIR